MSERISDERLADCIEVARQNAERLAANAHGRTRIGYDTVEALRELQERRERERIIAAALDEMAGLANHCIPAYAYGDSQAGSELARRCDQIFRTLDNLRVPHG